MDPSIPQTEVPVLSQDGLWEVKKEDTCILVTILLDHWTLKEKSQSWCFCPTQIYSEELLASLTSQ